MHLNRNRGQSGNAVHYMSKVPQYHPSIRARTGIKSRYAEHPNFVQSLLQNKAACKQQGQKGVVKYLQNPGWYPGMASLPVNLAATIYYRAECNRLDESLWLVLVSQRSPERASDRKWES
ncbi:hypothetical protein EMCG_09312, partial [[Emmonsia] crescens]